MRTVPCAVPVFDAAPYPTEYTQQQRNGPLLLLRDVLYEVVETLMRSVNAGSYMPDFDGCAGLAK